MFAHLHGLTTTKKFEVFFKEISITECLDAFTQNVGALGRFSVADKQSILCFLVVVQMKTKVYKPTDFSFLMIVDGDQRIDPIIVHS